METNGFGILIRKVSMRGGKIVMRGLAAVKLGKSFGTPKHRRMQLRIRGAEQNAVRSWFFFRKGLPFLNGYRVHGFRLEIPAEEAQNLDIQSKFDFWYDGEQVCDAVYDIFARREGAFRNTRPMRLGDKVVYFRQSISNKMWMVVRPENPYDSAAGRRRVFLAWLIAKLRGPSDEIIMYEKEASRYEESASVLFERLIDQGYRNVWYVINEDNPALRSLDEKYRSRMIWKDSFRHLLLFFRSKTFIGTETVDHALQLRAANRHIMSRNQSTDLTHVFLQHGVMYMVSLDADLRVGFVNRKVDRYRVVVSSEAEAMHFMLLGGFPREELYITGLAKFDRSWREPDSDLIMIMPTWRRWEANQAQRDFTGTGYYAMLRRMVEAVPEEDRKRIVIMPHPLMRRMMEKEQTDLSCYLRPDLTHDEVLRHCRLLMTDYSSIAYDAFYRGANVVFDWTDKEACMRHYGGAHLMINEYNVFGDVCRSPEELARAVQKADCMTQDPQHVRKYSRIVSFRDGKNTDRIIACLKKDGILKDI